MNESKCCSGEIKTHACKEGYCLICPVCGIPSDTCDTKEPECKSNSNSPKSSHPFNCRHYPKEPEQASKEFRCSKHNDQDCECDVSNGPSLSDLCRCGAVLEEDGSCDSCKRKGQTVPMQDDKIIADLKLQITETVISELFDRGIELPQVCQHQILRALRGILPKALSDYKSALLKRIAEEGPKDCIARIPGENMKSLAEIINEYHAMWRSHLQSYLNEK